MQASLEVFCKNTILPAKFFTAKVSVLIIKHKMMFSSRDNRDILYATVG